MEQSKDFYTVTKKRRIELVILFLAIGALSFLWHFPLGTIIDSTIRNQLSKNPTCPVLFDELKLNFFPPGYRMPNIQVPRQCFGPTLNSPQQKLSFKNTILGFTGLSFSPFGPAFSVETEAFNNKIELDLGIGLLGQVVHIEDNKIKIENIFRGLEKSELVMGDITINGLVKRSGSEIDDLKILLQSKNLTLTSQNLMGMLQIPQIPVKNFILKAQLGENKKILDLQELIIGNQESPVRLKMSGRITPRWNNFKLSVLNLKGELFISPELKKEFPILDMMLAKFAKENEFYQISIKGPASRPKLN